MMSTSDQNNWLLIMLIAFFGGIVSNIVHPVRRGLVGFCCAGLISVFCGGIAGVCSVRFGIDFYGQVLIAAVVAILSDRVLTAVLCRNLAIINNIQNNSDNATGVQGEGNKVNESDD